MLIRALAIIGLLTVGAVKASSHVTYSEDDEVYNQLVTIRGTVQILNHPELGKIAGSGLAILFRRTDCKHCVVVALTDKDGNYEIRVGRGRYKLVARESRGGGAPSYDLLAPNQQRYINATSSLYGGNHLDIKISLPVTR